MPSSISPLKHDIQNEGFNFFLLNQFKCFLLFVVIVMQHPSLFNNSRISITVPYFGLCPLSPPSCFWPCVSFSIFLFLFDFSSLVPVCPVILMQWDSPVTQSPMMPHRSGSSAYRCGTWEGHQTHSEYLPSLTDFFSFTLNRLWSHACLCLCPTGEWLCKRQVHQ